MFGPDEEEKSDNEKKLEQKETKDPKPKKEKKDSKETLKEEIISAENSEKKEAEGNKDDKKQDEVVVKETSKETEESEKARKHEDEMDDSSKADKTPEEKEITKDVADEPMNVCDEGTEPKGPQKKPEACTTKNAEKEGDSCTTSKKTEDRNVIQCGEGSSDNDIDNLLKIEQECATLQNWAAKQSSQTAKDDVKEAEVLPPARKQEEEEMEVDQDVRVTETINDSVKVRPNQEKREPEQPKPAAAATTTTTTEKPQQPVVEENTEKKELKLVEFKHTVMEDLSIPDLDDEALVIDESVNNTDDQEENKDSQRGETVEVSKVNSELSVDNEECESLAESNKECNDDVTALLDLYSANDAPEPDRNRSSLAEEKQELVSVILSPEEPMAMDEKENTELGSPRKTQSTSPKPVEIKPLLPVQQKVETMSELIRTLTSDSEPMRSGNAGQLGGSTVPAPVKKEDGGAPSSCAHVQTITPLASLQAVLTATQRSLPLPTTTAAEARLLQAGIQVGLPRQQTPDFCVPSQRESDFQRLKFICSFLVFICHRQNTD